MPVATRSAPKHATGEVKAALRGSALDLTQFPLPFEPSDTDRCRGRRGRAASQPPSWPGPRQGPRSAQGGAGRRVARNRFSARLSPPPIAAHGDAGTESQFFVCSSRRGLCLTAGRAEAGCFLCPSPGRSAVSMLRIGPSAASPRGLAGAGRAQVVSFLGGSGNRSHRFRISPRDVSFVLTGRHYPAVGRGDAALRSDAHRGGCLGQGSARALPGAESLALLAASCAFSGVGDSRPRGGCKSSGRHSPARPVVGAWMLGCVLCLA